MRRELENPTLNPTTIGRIDESRELWVLSELITFDNKQGKRIVAFHDFSPSAPKGAQWVLVLPGFGETKTEVLTIAYFLAKNGYHTLRFDYSDHVGESDGDILLTTLSKMKEDVLSSLDYISNRFGSRLIGAVGTSLASRPLLRAAREDRRIGFLASLVSVVDLRKTLFEIYRKDHFEEAYCGVKRGPMDILGFEVDSDNFLSSSINDGYENLSTTIEDVREIGAPLVFFAAENDAWVDLEDVRRVYQEAGSKDKKLIVMERAMHRLYENPQVVKSALKGIIHYARTYLPNPSASETVREPNLHEIGRRIRKEKERNRILHAVTKTEERDFWKRFLARYDFATNVHDYWNLLELIYRLLGGCRAGQRMLDAGCGTGNYGSFCLTKFAYKLVREPVTLVDKPLFSYVGIDFIGDGIGQARELHRALQTELYGEKRLVSPQQKPEFAYFIADLEEPLPFADNSFDQVCCNMVVSYLGKAESCAEDLMRVLRPESRIVVTSLKPFADLSQLYRNYVECTHTPEELKRALEIFNNIGRVKAKEADGVYRFFAEEELRELLANAGACDVETFRAFGNQVNIAVGTKA